MCDLMILCSRSRTQFVCHVFITIFLSCLASPVTSIMSKVAVVTGSNKGEIHVVLEPGVINMYRVLFHDNMATGPWALTAVMLNLPCSDLRIVGCRLLIFQAIIDGGIWNQVDLQVVVAMYTGASAVFFVVQQIYCRIVHDVRAMFSPALTCLSRSIPLPRVLEALPSIRGSKWYEVVIETNLIVAIAIVCMPTIADAPAVLTFTQNDQGSDLQ